MKKTKQESIKTKLEEQFEEFFKPLEAHPELPDEHSLAQPSPMKPITGIVTYGLHEEPILGE
jgi:hypothetical protein